MKYALNYRINQVQNIAKVGHAVVGVKNCGICLVGLDGELFQTKAIGEIAEHERLSHTSANTVQNLVFEIGRSEPGFVKFSRYVPRRHVCFPTRM